MVNTSRSLLLITVCLYYSSNNSLHHRAAALKPHSFSRRVKSSPTVHPTRSHSSSCPAAFSSSSFREGTSVYVHGGEQDSDVSLKTLSYYLIWSPHMFRRTMVTFVGLLFLQSSWSNRVILPHLILPTAFKSQGSSAFTTAMEIILLPLLSSACCSVQLLINVMVGAGGCAGFNKYLGPWRPYFLAILLSTIVPMIATGSVIRWPKLVFQILVAILPELVHVSNQSTFQRARRAITSKDGTSSTNRTTIQTGQQLLVTAEAEITIPGMGCVACIHKINNSIRQCANVTGSHAWLEDVGGKARVQYVVNSQDDVLDVALRFTEAVRNAGFDECVISSAQQIIL